MNACFLCGNQFQIVNCVNFVMGQEEYCFDKVDIYIWDSMRTADFTIEALRKEKIFDRIFRYNYKDWEKGFLSRMGARIDFLMSPGRFLKRVVMVDEDNPHEWRYSHIFLFGPDYITQSMIRVNPDARISFLDDGMASYVGKIGISGSSRDKKLIWRLVGKDFWHIYPHCLYVNNVSMCHTEWDVPVKPLPSLTRNEGLIDVMHRIFGRPMTEYDTIRTVILAQPYESEALLEDEEIKCCKAEGIEFILRPHPRQKLSDINVEVIDDSGALWELICAEKINDDYVLIGKCSTAQISPKLLYDKEPYVVFTYRLYDYISEEMRKYPHEMYLNIRDAYRNPEKVIEVENPQELRDVLNRLCEVEGIERMNSQRYEAPL